MRQGGKGAKAQRRKGGMKLNAIAGSVSLAMLWVGAPLASQGNALEPALALRVDSVYSRFTAPGSPGCAVGVVREGRLDYARGYGLASIEHGVPITPATVFDIGSVSKQFTALAIVLLAQDGTLSLDDEIQKFLPEIPRYQAGAITLRHLLHHTSGLRGLHRCIELERDRRRGGHRPTPMRSTPLRSSGAPTSTPARNSFTATADTSCSR